MLAKLDRGEIVIIMGGRQNKTSLQHRRENEMRRDEREKQKLIKSYK